MSLYQLLTDCHLKSYKHWTYGQNRQNIRLRAAASSQTRGASLVTFFVRIGCCLAEGSRIGRTPWPLSFRRLAVPLALRTVPAPRKERRDTGSHQASVTRQLPVSTYEGNSLLVTFRRRVTWFLVGGSGRLKLANRKRALAVRSAGQRGYLASVLPAEALVWVARGTRVPLAAILDAVAEGEPFVEIAEVFEITLQQLVGVLQFAAEGAASAGSAKYRGVVRSGSQVSA